MSDSHEHSAAHGHGEHEAHACPLWILTVVFTALLILTVLTVYTATQIDLGEFNLVLAMAIALVKGVLVALFFMHLWWDSKFNSIAIVAGMAFLALFLTFSLLDTTQYQSSLTPAEQVLTIDKFGEVGDVDHGAGDDAAGGGH